MPLTKNKSENIIEYLNNLSLDDTWSFKELTTKDTKYITHGYHRYPAKFIPQLASRLIKEFSSEGDLVVDPFMGSGTTLVEAKVLGRRSLGVDINPVAHLISQAKINFIEPEEPEKTFQKINQRFKVCKPYIPKYERIDYWFKKETRKNLGIIYSSIKEIKEPQIKTFFLCGFSNILKNCSIWLAKSNKPTRDFNKKESDPYILFNKQIKQMLKRNLDFCNLLKQNHFLNVSSEACLEDAKNIPLENNSANLIITSPPYVTSYEYADLHQLTAFWFEYASELSEFRKSFIGSAYNSVNKINLGSELAEETINSLQKNKTGKHEEVTIYFSNMRETFLEMHRYLKKGGKACIVIGDTAFKGVPILNAAVFIEQMQEIGFELYKIIKREIPSKNLPQTRDPETGKFTSLSNKNKVLAYPYEYVIIMEKV